MKKELLEIVEQYRAEGVDITDEYADEIQKYCYRKMEVAGIKKQEEYLPLLFKDEVKNTLFRQSVNLISMVRMFGVEAVADV